MNVDTITKNGQKFAILPLIEFERIVKDAEMLADIKAYDAAMAKIENGEDELIPASIIMRRLAGENTVKTWREYRVMTQEQLALESSVSRAMIAAIEVGHKQGSVTTLKKLTKALNCDINNLV